MLVGFREEEVEGLLMEEFTGRFIFNTLRSIHVTYYADVTSIESRKPPYALRPDFNRRAASTNRDDRQQGPVIPGKISHCNLLRNMIPSSGSEPSIDFDSRESLHEKLAFTHKSGTGKET